MLWRKIATARNSQMAWPRMAVREVHLEQLQQDLIDLHGYQKALVGFRLRGTVIGHAWFPVDHGCITAATLRASLLTMAWQIWQQLMGEPTAPSHPLPTASVVVCTRDRTDELAHCLPGLLPLAAQGYEVLIVDNCPGDDNTAQLVARHPSIRYVHEPRPGLDVARNRGLTPQQGRLLLSPTMMHKLTVGG